MDPERVEMSVHTGRPAGMPMWTSPDAPFIVKRPRCAVPTRRSPLPVASETSVLAWTTLRSPEPVFTATLSEAVGDAGELDVDELRRLATDALDAAMWMDQQARLGLTRIGPSVVELVREAHARSSRTA